MSFTDILKNLIIPVFKDAFTFSIKAVPVLLFATLLILNFQFYQLSNLINTDYIVFTSKFLSELLIVAGLFSLLFIAKLIKFKITRIAAGIALTVYFILDTALIYYYNYSGLYLNAFAFKTELRDIPKIIYTSLTSIDNFQIIALGIIIVFVLLIIGAVEIMNILYKFFQYNPRLQKQFFLIKSQKFSSVVILSFLIISPVLNINEKIPNQFTYFLKQYLKGDSASNIAKIYQDAYFESIKTNKQNNEIDFKNSKTVTGGDNFFIVQLESLNSKLVNDKLTPNLTGISQANGIFLPNIQGASVDTILSEEVTLCDTLPTIYGSLSQSPSLIRDMDCLPKILKKYGYKTLFFGNYSDLGFANYGNFMREVGFDEVHSADIMDKEDDKKYSLPWGYREDIFFQRVFDYIEKYKNEKIFVYIAVGATNHFPFYQKKSFDYFKNNVPFQNPSDFYEKIADTTFIQDYYLGQMYNDLFYQKYGQNSHLMIFGDHSFPFKNSIFSFSGFWQENFATSAAIIPSKNSMDKMRKGKILTQFYGQNDYMPTILEMLGINIANLAFTGRSFYNDLLLDNKNSSILKNQKHCLISAQPFSEGFISALQYPEKYVFGIRNNKIIKFNLETDPEEKTPFYATTDDAYTKILEKCLSNNKETSLNNSNAKAF